MTAAAYPLAAASLVAEVGVTVRRWRSGMSGRAFTSADDWGIEAPNPVGPISFGVFAHEVGHQTLHRHNSKPRWVEEVEAEEYALAQFDRFGLAGRDRYEPHAARNIAYSFDKAVRRGGPAIAARIAEAYPEWWARAEQVNAEAMLSPSMSRCRSALDRSPQ